MSPPVTVRQMATPSTSSTLPTVGPTESPKASSSYYVDTSNDNSASVSPTSILAIAISVIGILIFCGFLIYRRHKKQKNKHANTDGFDDSCSRSALEFAPTHFCAYHPQRSTSSKTANFANPFNGGEMPEIHSDTCGKCHNGKRSKVPRSTTIGGTFLNPW